MTRISNLAILDAWQNRLAEDERLTRLNLDLAKFSGDQEKIFITKSDLFTCLVTRGDRKDADLLWDEMAPHPRPRIRAVYRPGYAEFWRARDLFWRGALTEPVLANAETLAREGDNRQIIRLLLSLRGEWHLSRDEPDLAVAPLREAVRLARDVHIPDIEAEALLTLARLRTGDRAGARAEAERLGEPKGSAALPLARVWHELGDKDRAIANALRAHESAVADGEPYVWRYLLEQSRALLTELGAELPVVPTYDPERHKPYPWEADVRALIDKLTAERAEEDKPKGPKRPRKPR